MSKLNKQALMTGMAGAAKPIAVRDKFSDAAIAASDDVLSSPQTQNRGLLPVARAPEMAVETQPREDGPSVRGRTYTPGMKVEIGEKYYVSLAYVAANPNNPREFYNRDSIQSLADSIRREGQLTPAQAYAPKEEGAAFVLKEGHSRKMALAANGMDGITLEVVPPADSVMSDYRQAREINKLRNDITVFDDASRFQMLLDSGAVKTQEELAYALRESPEYVSKAINIGKLPSLLLKKMADATDYKFGMTMAHHVRMYYELKEDEAAAHKLVGKILESKMSVRQVELLVQTERAAKAEGISTTSGKAVHRLRPLSRALFKGAGEGELKYFPDGRFELNIAIQDEAKRGPLFNQVIETLRNLGIDVVSGVEA